MVVKTKREVESFNEKVNFRISNYMTKLIQEINHNPDRAKLLKELARLYLECLLGSRLISHQRYCEHLKIIEQV